MNANAILNSNVLDILFDNRNKQYGAYTLRRDYNKRLIAAIGLMFSLVAVFVICMSFKPKEKKVEVAKVIIIASDPTLSKVDPPKKEPDPIIQPKQDGGAPKAQIATIQSTTIKIVPDAQAPTPQVPLVDSLAGKVISTTTNAGAPGGDNIVQSNGNGGTGEGGAGGGKATVVPESTDDKTIFDKAEHMPEFPGGQAAMTRFLLKNLRPMTDDEARVVKVAVRFIVDKQGAVTGFEVVNSGGTEYDKEVLRVLKKMPNWKPGSQNGHSVNVYMTLPVVFQTQEE